MPLDPSYPADRLVYMAEDAGLAHVVTHGSFGTLFDGPPGGFHLWFLASLALGLGTVNWLGAPTPAKVIAPCPYDPDFARPRA